MIKVSIKKPNPISLSVSVAGTMLGVQLIRQALFENEGFLMYLILTIGVLNILLFGTLFYLLIIRFLIEKNGLEMDDEKLIFRPNEFQNTKLYWKDISDIKFKMQRGQHYILPIINRPEEAIAIQNNWFLKKIMKTNFRKFQTPILIDANNYDSNFEQLKQLITDQFNKVKHQNH